MKKMNAENKKTLEVLMNGYFKIDEELNREITWLIEVESYELDFKWFAEMFYCPEERSITKEQDIARINERIRMLEVDYFEYERTLLQIFDIFGLDFNEEYSKYIDRLDKEEIAIKGVEVYAF